MPTPRAAALVLAAAAVPAVLAGCASTPAADAPLETSMPGPDSTPGGTSSPEQTPAFADGTYTADGDYLAPSGPESVTVTVTLEGGVVTDVAVEGHATDPEAQEFQGRFVSGIAAEVVGQPIDSLDVSHVAGSSLTSGGFNAAIETIKEQSTA